MCVIPIYFRSFYSSVSFFSHWLVSSSLPGAILMKTVIIKSQETESSSSVELDAESMSQLDAKVYNLLSQKGPTTRSQLSKLTGVARSTLYDSLLRLSLKGMVKKYSDSDHNSRGRPKVYFEAI